MEVIPFHSHIMITVTVGTPHRMKCEMIFVVMRNIVNINNDYWYNYILKCNAKYVLRQQSMHLCVILNGYFIIHKCDASEVIELYDLSFLSFF